MLEAKLYVKVYDLQSLEKCKIFPYRFGSQNLSFFVRLCAGTKVWFFSTFQFIDIFQMFVLHDTKMESFIFCFVKKAMPDLYRLLLVD